MRVLQVGTLPIYLPYDKAPVPFGDPIEGVTATAAAPGVITNPDLGGYVPVNGDAVALTFLTGGSMPGGLTYGQLYYVVSAVAATGLFSLAATKGGAAITTTTTGASLVLHLLSGQVDGVALPFKAGGTVVVENNTGGSLTLSTAADTGQAAPGQGYNPPAGPGSFTVIATVAAGGAVEVVLNNDWVKASGTLILQQN